MDFTGANIADITKMNQSDIFRNITQTVVGTVNVPAGLADGDALPMGTLLTSSDGGLTWDTLTTQAYVAGAYAVGDQVYYEGHIYENTVLDNEALPTDPSWTDIGVWNANGVLYNDLTASGKTTVVTSADVVKKNLGGFDEFLRVVLFENNILVK